MSGAAPPMRRRGRSRGPEAQTLAGCLELLRLRGWLAIRTNSGTVRIGKHWVRLAKAGTSDILACARGGRFWAIETKAPSGRLTKEQRMFLAQVRELGGVAVVVNSVEELQRCIAEQDELDQWVRTAITKAGCR